MFCTESSVIVHEQRMTPVPGHIGALMVSYLACVAPGRLGSLINRALYWSENRRRRIDFMIIGIQKAGTSWLSARLHEVPDIQLSYPKETQFFKFRWRPEYDQWSPERVRARYLRRFWSPPRAKILFEASPGYVVDGAIARRVARILPDVRLIVVLRNPVHRAYSAYNMWVRNRQWPLSFQQTCLPVLERARQASAQHGDRLSFYQSLGLDVPDNLISYGLYYYHLIQWFEVFPRDRFYVMTTADLNNPERLADLLSFVGAEREGVAAMQLGREAAGKHLGAPISDTDRERLEAFFAPYNQILFKLLDVPDLDW
ncbi:MAG: sulfotransferase [Saprospiraceae bacterium]|nr:sulfotransferase [Saprospiraceae bacterium]